MSKKRKYDAEPLLLSTEHIDIDDLSDNQRHAAKMFSDWVSTKKRKKEDMVLRIGGGAGSGKTFLIRYLIEAYGYDSKSCYVVSYTGQAVNVLRQDGVLAKTIHSTFMHSTEEPLLNEKGKQIRKSGIPLMTTRFTPVKSIPSSIELVIIDESSFLPESLEEMILRYNVPILEMGDPIQLPPVTGRQCFNMDNLDFFMEGNKRQTKGSEIIDLATKIRHYEPIDITQYQNEVRFLWAQEDIETTFSRYRPMIKGSDIIITSTNKQRSIINEMYRDKIIRTKSPFPEKGEKLICRKNDWGLMLSEYPLTNGTQGTAVHHVGRSDVSEESNTFILDFQPSFISNDYFDGLLCDTKFLRAPCGNKNMSYYENLNPGKKFEYAYAVTTQLSQGGAYPTVMFMDSFSRDPEYHMRQRYTAVTRARKKLYYILPLSAKYPLWTDLTSGGFRT